jgi:heptosyltransferase-2
MKRILINALPGIGDALMFTPALKFLKESIPDSEIDVMVMYKSVEDIYKRIPLVNKVFYHDFLKESPFSSLNFVLSLRNKYDYSINIYPTNRKEYNIINLLVGAEKRAGVTYLNLNKREFGFLNNIKILEDDKFHNVEHNIKLVEKLIEKKCDDISGLIFPLTDSDIQFSNKFIDENNLSNEKLLIGIHAGSSTLKNHINKRWSPEKFAELSKILISEFNAFVMIFGGPDEIDLKEKIKSLTDSERIISVNTKSMAQTAALIKRCGLFISNDTGLMHTAAAMQTNTAAIFGPTNTNLIKPWNVNHIILSLDLDCQPCFYNSPNPLKCYRDDVQFKCLKELSPKFAFNKIKNFMERINLLPV